LIKAGRSTQAGSYVLLENRAWYQIFRHLHGAYVVCSEISPHAAEVPDNVCAREKSPSMPARQAKLRAPQSAQENLRVVLVSTRNPLNLGAAARAMSNFGFMRLRVVHPYDVAFREARSAVGASEVLRHAEEFSSLTSAVADCSLVVGTTAVHNRAPEQPILRLERGARDIRTHLSSGRCALVFGSEKVGLPKDALDHCHFLLHIPTRTAHRSMNLGQAVAICLYELARETRLTKQAVPAMAAAADLERVAASLLDALMLSGYLKPGTEAATRAKVRRLLRRMGMQTGDAELLLGMLRKIVWKLRSR
jgi:TrmH family RNA methyltransferase